MAGLNAIDPSLIPKYSVTVLSSIGCGPKSLPISPLKVKDNIEMGLKCKRRNSVSDSTYWFFPVTGISLKNICVLDLCK